MKTWISAAAVLASTVGNAAGAQQTFYWPAPQTSAQPTQTTYFPAGTPLSLITQTQISTKDNKPGDRVYLSVAESLSYRGQVIIPAGAVATGEVALADRNGHFGKKGRLAIRVVSIETPSGPVRLGGGASDEGTSGAIVSFATIAFISPLGFLVHGTSAQIPIGTVVQAHLGEPLRFAEQPGARVVMGEQVQPDGVQPKALPARFDPTVFGGAGNKPASR